MIVLERQIQKVIPGKWTALEEIDKRFGVLENKFDFPPKKRYQYIFGGQDTNTLIIERQWESMAAFEETFTKVMASPEHQALVADMENIVSSTQFEVLTPLP